MEKKQQMLLEAFFEKRKTWEYVMGNFVAAILIGISMIIWIMPYQIWESDESYIFWGVIMWNELIGFTFYIKKFSTYKEDGQKKRIDEVIKYLPISYKQLVWYRMKKLAKICVWLTGISMLCQTVFAIAFLHTFSAGNIFIPLISNFIVPVLSEGSEGVFKAV